MLCCIILLYMLMMLLSILSVMNHLIPGNNSGWLLYLKLTKETLWIGLRSGSLNSMLKEFNLFHLIFWASGATDVKMDGHVLHGKPSFKMLEFPFSSRLNSGSCIALIAKTSSDRIRALIHLIKFPSSQVVLYVYESTIGNYMDHWLPCLSWCPQLLISVSSHTELQSQTKYLEKSRELQ